MTKARFNVVVRKQKVTGLVKAIAMGASKPQTPEITVCILLTPRLLTYVRLD